MIQVNQAAGLVPISMDPLTGFVPEDSYIDSPFLSAQEWRESPHFRKDLSFPNGVKESVASILAARKDEENARKDVLSRSPSGALAFGTRLATDLVVSALDPINLASAFVPVVSEARFAGMIARHGKTLARGMKGVVEGAAGAAMVEPLVLGASLQEQADYGMADSLLNVGLGGVLGGGLHVGVGALADRLAKARPHTREGALRASVGQFAGDREIDVDPVFKVEKEPIQFDPGSLETPDRLAGPSPVSERRSRLESGSPDPIAQASRDMPGLIERMQGFVGEGRISQDALATTTNEIRLLNSQADTYGDAVRRLANCLIG
jgi:hypothetical protein